MLTAAAAILGMVPLNPSIWGPMAVAIAGGLLGVAILSLPFMLYGLRFSSSFRHESS
jgi:multidrug efflux pump subunit AcrB